MRMKWSVIDIVTACCILALSILTAFCSLTFINPRMGVASSAGVASIGPLLGFGLGSLKIKLGRAHILSCMLWGSLAVFLFVFFAIAGSMI